MNFVYIETDKFFDLKKTVECGQCFHYRKIDNGYIIYGMNDVCIVYTGEKGIYIKANNIEYWKDYFALNVNYEEIFRYLKSFAEENNDSFALKSLENGRGIRILKQPFFETCLSFIISQRNNIPRIQKTIFNLSESFSSRRTYLDEFEYRPFPTLYDMKQVSLEELKKAGLGYRAEYVYDFVRSYDDIMDKIKFNYKNDLDLFLSCRGIGEKVANCICLYGFNEYDAFPIDVWMQRIIDNEYISKGKTFKKPQKYAGILQQFMFYTIRSENNG